jgi:hypothetical protein
MSQSPADRATETSISASSLLLALERAYDEALAASMRGDLETCAEMLAASDALLSRSADTTVDANSEEAHQRALAAHARLLAILQGQRDECGEDLARAQLGKKALQGYAGERQLGARVERQA